MVGKTSFAALASVLLFGVGTTAQTFDAADVTGAFEDPSGADLKIPSEVPDGVTLTRPALTKKGVLLRMCDCSDDQPALSSIRKLSDDFLADGTRISSHGFTNLVWAWGQFIDHDIVATVDGTDDDFPADIITLKDKRGMTADMRLHRLISDGPSTCPTPVVVNTAHVDAGTVYGTEDDFLQKTLRQPNSCMLRTSGGNMLPITTKPNSDGNYAFLAGDARVDEHSVLTMMHTVWMREHNRICDHMNKDSEFSGMSNDAKFQRARNVVIAKMQDITVREWLPLLGISEKDLRDASPLHGGVMETPDISVEFSTAAYRFGHDMVPDTLGPMLTVDLFNGNDFYGIEKTGESDFIASSKLDDVALFAAQSRANEIDGKLTDTLRDLLFGSFGEDLGSRNIYRGGDMHIANYGMLADCYSIPKSSNVPASSAPFIGLLKENADPTKDVFGPVQRAILVEQFHRIFFGKGGKWWENRKADVAGFEKEIHDATMGSVINANTRAFVQHNAFKLGGGGSKHGPDGGDGSDGGDGGDKGDGDDKDFPGAFPGGFPGFPKDFPEF